MPKFLPHFVPILIGSLPLICYYSGIVKFDHDMSIVFHVMFVVMLCFPLLRLNFKCKESFYAVREKEADFIINACVATYTGIIIAVLVNSEKVFQNIYLVCFLVVVIFVLVHYAMYLIKLNTEESSTLKLPKKRMSTVPGPRAAGKCRPGRCRSYPHTSRCPAYRRRTRP